ncbi:MAG TPA: hypothetical protein VD963_01540 [Phycisphaerales bacterium]|nr:hypothetical protein [Phycisphaerales bacterium]
MPASRSRTEHWADCLRKIAERGGGIEIALDRGTADAPGAPPEPADLIWRVHVLELNDRHLVIEAPAAAGRTVELAAGAPLIGAMSVGQNRWMFHTRVIGPAGGGAASRPALLLAHPSGLERCTRRNLHRISTAGLNLPAVSCWPLLDPTSVIAAETANRVRHAEARAGTTFSAPRFSVAGMTLPEVGPMFPARLVNVSGGGLGLQVARADAAAAESRPYLWLALDLAPDVPVPVAVSARVAHTHLDSAQNLYAGVAFDFTHHPEHRAFVLEVVAAYVARIQDAQRRSGQLRAA